MAFIDGLRGFAALIVAVFHFYSAIVEHNQSLGSQFSWPIWIQRIAAVGDRGVAVFFALSGFVIAYSIRQATVDGRFVGVFALRRSLRLDPTYWIVIAITCFVTWLVPGRAAYSGGDVLANLFYVNKLLNFRGIVAVGWTLCLEVQFYLTFIGICYLARIALREKFSVPRQFFLFIPLALYSLAMRYNFIESPSGLFVPYWFMFFFGGHCLVDIVESNLAAMALGAGIVGDCGRRQLCNRRDLYGWAAVRSW